MHRFSSLAFTLVELLVVVAVIVALLALLVPALDQAMYQAELAMCGANEHAIGAGVLSYAMGNKRFYPDRPPAAYAFDLRSGPKKDFRPSMKRAVGPINRVLTCPLASGHPLRYEEAKGDATGTFQVVNTYNIWFNFKFTRTSDDSLYDPVNDPTNSRDISTDRVMRKLGDRFTYTDLGSGPPEVTAFGALASDRDVVHVQLNEAQSSHPDKTGSMANYIREDGVIPTQESLGPAASLFTIAIWWLPGDPKRGPTDDNFLIDDGSVRRVKDIHWDSREELGLSWVPIQNNDARRPPNGYMFLPRGS